MKTVKIKYTILVALVVHKDEKLVKCEILEIKTQRECGWMSTNDKMIITNIRLII